MSESNCGLIVLVVILFIFIIMGSIGGGCYCYSKNLEVSEKFEESKSEGVLYNPLYTSPDLSSPGAFRYTQPPGDTQAQQYSGNGQGTSGEFLPLQGRAAGTFMKNSSNGNLALPSTKNGMIGGFPNYTQQDETPAWIGFNDVGIPGEIANSYLVEGATQRVLNPGQQGVLPASKWWPALNKNVQGFAVQASDDLVGCDKQDLADCPNSERFLKSKYEPMWKGVVSSD